MVSKQKILIIIGGNYWSEIKRAEQYLPHYLSRYHQVTCFEYPQFTKMARLLKKEIPLLEKLNNNLVIYHSFGILPYGRIFVMINLINHFFNYLIMKIIIKKVTHFDLIISFTPEVAFLPVKNQVKLIYHVLDDYAVLPWWNNPLSRFQLKILEEKTIKRADEIIAVSKKLAAKFKKYNKNIYLYPTPADLSNYFVFNKQKQKINDILSIKRPIVGFIGSGTIKGKIDLQLLNYLADKYPEINFVFIGLFDESIIDFRGYPNLINLGYKPLQLLSSYIKHFDVGIIPYCLNRFGQSAYPVKIMEYLALGKPVVSTFLPSLDDLAQRRIIYTAESTEEFAKNIKIALKEKDENLKKARIGEAKKNDWKVRIIQYLKFLELA
ncbi:hypothetical protein A3D78_01425 [Candidatus Gottesmanbacteria bacterium RIFCSPHIGHO2_02_FULL_39_14]|uniref:Glycosyl transferase family 1 domain-containing protein n=1 Tax=Candidatus Gottesmanbacteria bacterium RIFCSPHIGHO2_02_FULL_39_14 TaxID=1798383 RepID=A0A1F5ZW91_9BACT|nr:MAG: hypothetical protein A3D78_01425 [Candidatus Gottesmanbacteria bacterium RIFCSPHIGHO2_02_FULL_39_14]